MRLGGGEFFQEWLNVMLCSSSGSVLIGPVHPRSIIRGICPIAFFSGWWFGTFGKFFHILGMSSYQLTNSYFSEGFKPPTRY
jgi:hypothetical protein